MASIKGLQKTSLVDFPPYVSCTIFISTCNLRCGFCYNKELVMDSSDLKEYSEDEILKFLDKRKNVLDGVCITGGEPLLYKNLRVFITKVKEKGFKVKLDTNGTNPERLKELIDARLLDYIAMDVKNSLEMYDETAGCKADINAIKRSIEIIKNSGVNYEFRTTVVPGLHTKEDMKKIGELLKGSEKFAIQNFRPDKNVIDVRYRNIKPFSKEELGEFKRIVEGYIKEIEMRL